MDFVAVNEDKLQTLFETFLEPKVQIPVSIIKDPISEQIFFQLKTNYYRIETPGNGVFLPRKLIFHQKDAEIGLRAALFAKNWMFVVGRKSIQLFKIQNSHKYLPHFLEIKGSYL